MRQGILEGFAFRVRDALIRTVSALPLTNGGEVIYVGMYGTAEGGATLAGHVMKAVFNPGSSVAPAWQGLSRAPAALETSRPGIFAVGDVREEMIAEVGLGFGGEWADVKELYPRANEEQAAWVQPGVTAEQVKAYHRAGKAVVANFSANDHEMDLAGMKTAVTAGVDGINVDYPRLGADAVGRPVERKLAALASQADVGESAARARAILELSRYRGFALESEFTHWLLDPDDHVSRAAAVALVIARPSTPPAAFADALRSGNADARANAAWSLGRLGAPASMLLPLLQDKSPQVLQETLLALSRMPGDVSAEALLPLLSHSDPRVRGGAALAMARHQPNVALKAVPVQLRLEMKVAIQRRWKRTRSWGTSGAR